MFVVNLLCHAAAVTLAVLNDLWPLSLRTRTTLITTRTTRTDIGMTMGWVIQERRSVVKLTLGRNLGGITPNF